MNYQQINWFRNEVSSEDLGKIAMMLAADDWDRFRAYAARAGVKTPTNTASGAKSLKELLAPHIKQTRSFEPTEQPEHFVSKMSDEEMGIYRAIYTHNGLWPHTERYPARVDVVRQLRQDYNLTLKVAKEWMEFMEARGYFEPYWKA
jgi:hypothetical protein